MRVHEETLAHVRALVARLQAVPNGFYVSRLAGIHPEDIRTEEDFLSLPFTDKNDLRSAYPLGLAAVPPREIVRVHASSGTTGAPVVIPYTKKDIADWADMMARSLAIAGVGPDDRLQIATGFGMWTAGSGFQTGIERLGAMAIPAGPGNTARQLRFLIDMEATVLCATASYALQLGEEAQKRGLLDQLRLKKAIIGAEHWTQKTGEQIANLLGVEIYDMYGLTEIYGPGTGVSCAEHDGMHMLDEMLLYEVIDPHTLRPVPDGETGELVITTLFKEGAPLLRYRTHDLTRVVPGECPCGLRYPRLERILGRTDDMVKYHGVNIFPGQIDELLRGVEGANGEYQLHLRHENQRDSALLRLESISDPGDISARFRSLIGVSIDVEVVPLGSLPRSEKKTRRIFDFRGR